MVSVEFHLHGDANFFNRPRVRVIRVVPVAYPETAHPAFLRRALNLPHHRRGETFREPIESLAGEERHRGGVERVLVVVLVHRLELEDGAVLEIELVVDVDDAGVILRLVDDVLFEEEIVVGFRRGVRLAAVRPAERLEHVRVVPGIGGVRNPPGIRRLGRHFREVRRLEPFPRRAKAGHARDIRHEPLRLVTHQLLHGETVDVEGEGRRALLGVGRGHLPVHDGPRFETRRFCSVRVFVRLLVRVRVRAEPLHPAARLDAPRADGTAEGKPAEGRREPGASVAVPGRAGGDAVQSNRALTHLAVRSLLDPQLEHAVTALVLCLDGECGVVRIRIRGVLRRGSSAFFDRAGSPAGASPCGVLQQREVSGAVRRADVSSVLRGDLHHDAVHPPGFVFAVAAAGPPSDEAGAGVAVLGGGGEILRRDGGAVGALHRRHGIRPAHRLDGSLQAGRLGEVLGGDRELELALGEGGATGEGFRVG